MKCERGNELTCKQGSLNQNERYEQDRTLLTDQVLRQFVEALAMSICGG